MTDLCMRCGWAFRPESKFCGKCGDPRAHRRGVWGWRWSRQAGRRNQDIHENALPELLGRPHPRGLLRQVRRTGHDLHRTVLDAAAILVSHSSLVLRSVSAAKRSA
jgi:ribosomal protein L37E